MAPPDPTPTSLIHLFDLATEPGALLQLAAVLDALPIAIGIAECAEGATRFLHVNRAAIGIFEDERPVAPHVNIHPLPTPPGRSPRFLYVDTSSDAKARVWRLTAKWRLTDRQSAVLLEAAHGGSNKDIGLALGLAEATVEMHLTALYKAAAVDGRAALVAAFWTR